MEECSSQWCDLLRQAQQLRGFLDVYAECSRQTAGFGFLLLPPCFPGFGVGDGEAKTAPKGRS